ncbi:S8 family peptidase [Curtobacterium sp. MCBA15_013]|uniref:S8 family peptidase n=1 Tax=Curtobacterium sp. MCBA15_013 TaxID=1898739 RepID=UPI0008DE595C|nr:S8 family peptidase [Curtobacterium sp. MCBA15_013]OII18434.1 hypothetical protein BIV01_02505 [Curtobacterium sp. MCBA15_013]
MAQTNYLIGYAERLVEPIGAPQGGGDKLEPYTIEQARERLAPQLSTTIVSFTEDAAFTPNGVHVARFALHPTYIAKSYHPAGMLRAAGLEVIGSKSRKIRVDRHTGSNPTDETYTTSELYVAGTAGAFESLRDALIADADLATELAPIRRFEQIAPFAAEEKVKAGLPDSTDSQFELVLHRPSETLAPDNRAQFLATAEQVGVQLYPEHGFDVGTLWFVPARGDQAALRTLAQYTTLRTVRPMPRLTIEPVLRSVSLPQMQLPPAPERDDAIRVAILDGGLPDQHPLGPWVESYRRMNPAAADLPNFTDHGLAVASAFLFGPLTNGEASTPPPAKVSVIRVLDESIADEDEFELYRVLSHIEDVLTSNAYDYINLSLGPNLPVEDDDVHAWTSVIDDLLSDGQTLMTVAAGNNGELDAESGNARVQVPGDGVNLLTVGAADSRDSGWARAPYSAIGPGRHPGRVKPDVLMFGGSTHEPFNVLSASGTGIVGVTGTSFGAPYGLRHAVGIRALLGGDLSPLAIRTLMVHAARRDTHTSAEVGWGRVPDDFEDLVVSGDGVARIIYQGELKPGKYVRAKVPIPTGGFTGDVRMRATFCYASPVDAHSPDVYTRAALEPIFRPNLSKYAKGAKTPKSRRFFSQLEYVGEERRRNDFGQWETVLSDAALMRGKTLASPVFDIHYNAREEGGKSSSTESMSYALVITLEAAKHVNLHQDILDAYPDLLVAIEPDLTAGAPEVDV